MKNSFLHLATTLLLVNTQATFAAPEVSAHIMDLGNPFDEAAAPDRRAKFFSISTIYKGKIYMGAVQLDNTHTPDITTYDLSTHHFDYLRKPDGSHFNITQEKVLGMQVVDNNLLVSAEDEHTSYTGFMADDSLNGWYLQDLPGNAPHIVFQYKFDGHYLTTVPAGSAGVSVGSPFHLLNPETKTWIRGSDPNRSWSDRDDYYSRNMFELWGHLFADGSSTEGIVAFNTNSLAHYSGVTQNSWEVVYDKSKEIHSAFETRFAVPITGGVEIGDLGLLLGGRNVVRVRKQMATGAFGAYPKPIGEALVSSNAYKMFKKHGTAYIVENTPTLTTVRYSYNLTTWSTLFTLAIGTGKPLQSEVNTMEIWGDAVYLPNGLRLYKLPASSFGGLPTAQNLAPIAQDDTYSVEPLQKLNVYLGADGVLSNDNDANADSLHVISFTQPARGTVTMEGNGTFVYQSTSSSRGFDTFSYTVTDGIASDISTVTIDLGNNVSATTQRLADGAVILGSDGIAYDSAQDGAGGKTSALSVSADRRSAKITGNVWKSFPLNYTVTANTMLEFTVFGSDIGELTGISLDNDNSPTNTGPGASKRAFIFGGSDITALTWANRLTPPYVKNAPAQTYLIPVGSFFTGAVTKLGLIGNDDATGTTNINIRNIRLYEAGAPVGYATLSGLANWGATPIADRDADRDANNNGISNIMELAFNMNPSATGGPVILAPGTGTRGLPVTSVITPATPTLRTEYLRRKNSRLNYKLRFSDDLATWVDAVASPTVTSINSDWERVIIPDTAGSGRKKRFSRVVVSEAP